MYAQVSRCGCCQNNVAAGCQAVYMALPPSARAMTTAQTCLLQSAMVQNQEKSLGAASLMINNIYVYTHILCILYMYYIYTMYGV